MGVRDIDRVLVQDPDHRNIEEKGRQKFQHLEKSRDPDLQSYRAGGLKGNMICRQDLDHRSIKEQDYQDVKHLKVQDLDHQGAQDLDHRSIKDQDHQDFRPQVLDRKDFTGDRSVLAITPEVVIIVAILVTLLENAVIEIIKVRDIHKTHQDSEKRALTLVNDIINQEKRGSGQKEVV